MEIRDLRDKRVAILGLKVEGTSLCNFLIDKVKSITIFDRLSSEKLVEDVDVELASKIQKIIDEPTFIKKLGVEFPEDMDEFDIIFRSPSFYFNDSRLTEAKSHGIIVSSQIKLFFDLCPAIIVGVTGTKGKGTTASLILSILEKNFKDQISSDKPNVYLAGNIGYEALGLLDKLKENDIVILELSNFQLSDMEVSPEIAVVTNIGIDHLDYHPTREEYEQAKFNILKYQHDNNIAILNHDSTFSPDLLGQVESKIQYFSKSSPDAQAIVSGFGGEASVFIDPRGKNTKICKESEIKLVGRHNLENIAAASLAALDLGVEPDVITEVVEEFQGLEHRLELVSEIDGVKFINDSFATNPGPTVAAIDSFMENKVLILGGSEKGADFSEMADMISKRNVSAVILIGIEGSRIRKALELSNYKGKMVDGGNDIESIVERARENAKSGDVVIFSPACASFDMFKNYKDRGFKFKAAVMALKDV